ncbi:hypothetical protein HF521_011778 [Silurus meridionalis]|uniref:DDE Tnp4 domain-containing protein n=1 Tax=Silurus meridionalis TaxID=175797 RepID=A0A8T0ACJ6_SILME|nr:hypothetical protein HF521_011778 [Silurus meridionalis]
MAGVVHRHHHFARRGYRQRVYVERTKPLEQYTTEELYVRFRFGKADIEYLVNLLRDLQTNQPDGIILGDSAYPLLPWLMTPFLTANTLAQARFNTVNCRARCAIERLNRVLKRRFTCLNYLRAEPQKACNITLACIVLHNIATKRNVPLCADNDAPEPPKNPNQPPAFCQNEQTGRATRDAIVRHYF